MLLRGVTHSQASEISGCYWTALYSQCNEEAVSYILQQPAGRLGQMYSTVIEYICRGHLHGNSWKSLWYYQWL